MHIIVFFAKKPAPLAKSRQFFCCQHGRWQCVHLVARRTLPMTVGVRLIYGGVYECFYFFLTHREPNREPRTANRAQKKTRPGELAFHHDVAIAVITLPKGFAHCARVIVVGQS